jgi:hypothetical protein
MLGFSLAAFAQNDELTRSLDYINDQFKKYNAYNVQFSIDQEGKNLLSRSVFFEVTYPIDQISTIYSSQRGDKDCIVYFKCRNDEQCFSSTNLKDNSTDLKSEYSFNLEASLEIAEKVAAEFVNIQNSILNKENEPEPVSETNININSALEYINNMLKKHNDFNVQFSIDSEKKILKSISTFYEIIYYPSTLYSIDLVTRGLNDYKISFTCKLDVTCLTSIDLRSNKTELINSYPINFNGSTEDANKIINYLNQILQQLGK